ncbi:hypothetical protein N8Z47_04045 [Salibacteraceae bacterium]|nr:hypothetical protein [Salibacteraceae bacterium]
MTKHIIALLYLFLVAASSLLSQHTQIDSVVTPRLKHGVKFNPLKAVIGNVGVTYEYQFKGGDAMDFSIGLPVYTVYNTNHDIPRFRSKYTRGFTGGISYHFMSKKRPRTGWQLQFDYKHVNLGKVNKICEWSSQSEGEPGEGTSSKFFPERRICDECSIEMIEQRQIFNPRLFYIVKTLPNKTFLFEYYVGPSFRIVYFDYDILELNEFKNDVEFSFTDYHIRFLHLYPMFHMGFRIGMRT